MMQEGDDFPRVRRLRHRVQIGLGQGTPPIAKRYGLLLIHPLGP
jgi:hypothetical protein